MPLEALALVLVAAALHAGWNLLVKRAVRKQLFTWCALVVGALCYTPLLLIGPRLPARVWPYVVVSALVEAIYYLALTRAYSNADFSLVYPLARGAAPGLLALWAVIFLGEEPRPAGIAGLGLIVLGLVTVGSGAYWRMRQDGHTLAGGSGIGLALGIALCISVYSAIDGAAVRFAPSGPYLVMVIGLTAALVTPAVLAHYGRQAIATEWRTNWPRIIAVGVMTLLTYLLVLRAYALARVSYAGAIREVSIVFAALLGWRWLGEAFGAIRTTGALLIFSGILVIAVAG